MGTSVTIATHSYLLVTLALILTAWLVQRPFAAKPIKTPMTAHPVEEARSDPATSDLD